MTASPNYFYLDGQKLVANDNGDGTKTLVVSGGGGGGGSGFADILYTDDTGAQFVYRDLGLGTMSAYTVPTGAAYTVGTNPRPYNPATQPISAVSLPLPTGAATESTLATLASTQAATSGSGTVTSASPAVFSTLSKGTAVFTASGTWVGTIIVEATIDGTNWFTTSYVSVATGNTSTTFTAPTQGQINTVGFTSVRLRSNTISSGSATIVWTGSPWVSNVMMDNPLPAGSNNIGNINNVTGTVSLPTGASTETTLAALNSVEADTSGTFSLSSVTSTAFSVSNKATLQIAFSGTYSATLVLETSMDGTTWTSAVGAINVTNNLAIGTLSSGVTGRLNTAGLQQVRVRCSAYTSGTANITWVASRVPVSVQQSGPVLLGVGTSAIGSILNQRPFAATVTITRPANTTAYVAGQLISTATTGLTALPTFAMPSQVSLNQRTVINNISVISNNGAAATKCQFAVFLFGVASPSGAGFNDASTFAPTAAASAAVENGMIGAIPTLLPLGTAAYGYMLANQAVQINNDSSNRAVYLALVALNAYTPASGETFSVTINGYY